jgi:hypothetical protein
MRNEHPSQEHVSASKDTTERCIGKRTLKPGSLMFAKMLTIATPTLARTANASTEGDHTVTVMRTTTLATVNKLASLAVVVRSRLSARKTSQSWITNASHVLPENTGRDSCWPPVATGSAHLSFVMRIMEWRTILASVVRQELLFPSDQKPATATPRVTMSHVPRTPLEKMCAVVAFATLDMKARFMPLMMLLITRANAKVLFALPTLVC